MTSKYHKKIHGILKEANLPKNLSDEVKKELESYFYEKELDLRFAGLKPDEIQKQMAKDFGNEKLIVQHLNFVHKKSFYSFIKNLMQNKNKPSIFETVMLFFIICFLYQNILSDIFTQNQISTLYRDLHFYNTDDFISTFLLLILNLILIVRLYRGGELSQKLTSVGLLIFMVIQFGYNYFSAASHLTTPQEINNIPDNVLLQRSEDFYDSFNTPWVNFYNEKEGYQLDLPLSYSAFKVDGTSDLVKYFSSIYPIYIPEPGEIVAFGPAFAEAKEKIDIKIFDTHNSPEKNENETWTDYYLRTQLAEGTYKIESRESSDFYQKATKITLENPIEGRKNLMLVETNKLFVFLYNHQNPIHEEILNTISYTSGENDKWITFDNASCPFTLEVPDYWRAWVTTQNVAEHRAVPFDFVKDCSFDSFGPSDGRTPGIYFKWLKDKDLESYFKSQNLVIKGEERISWQDFPAKRILLEEHVDKQSVFAIQLKEDEWLIFQSLPQDEQVEKILNSLQIKIR